MKMGSSQKQNIGVQHRLWNKTAKTHTMTCEEWRDHRFNQLKNDGVTIEHGMSNGQEAWRLTNTRSKTVIVVPQAEISADYERCYLKKGVEA